MPGTTTHYSATLEKLANQFCNYSLLGGALCPPNEHGDGPENSRSLFRACEFFVRQREEPFGCREGEEARWTAICHEREKPE